MELSIWGLGANLRPPRDDGGGVAVCVWRCRMGDDLAMATGDILAPLLLLPARDFLADLGGAARAVAVG